MKCTMFGCILMNKPAMDDRFTIFLLALSKSSSLMIINNRCQEEFDKWVVDKDPNKVYFLVCSNTPGQKYVFFTCIHAALNCYLNTYR